MPTIPILVNVGWGKPDFINLADIIRWVGSDRNTTRIHVREEGWLDCYLSAEQLHDKIQEAIVSTYVSLVDKTIGDRQ